MYSLLECGRSKGREQWNIESMYENRPWKHAKQRGVEWMKIQMFKQSNSTTLKWYVGLSTWGDYCLWSYFFLHTFSEIFELTKKQKEREGGDDEE